MPESNKSAPTSQSIKIFSDITGKEFILIEVRIDNKNIGFSREELLVEGFEGFKDMFSVTFDKQMLAGIGAPNRYSAPYTLENENGISIKMMRSTLMASFNEPENLKEYEYFKYLQNAYKWNIVNEKLEFHSKTEDGVEVLMIFMIKP
jgi:heat shock protein HslJ